MSYNTRIYKSVVSGSANEFSILQKSYIHIGVRIVITYRDSLLRECNYI